MAQDYDFISVVDVGFVKGLLFQRTSIDQENVLEPRDLVPNLGVNLVASSLIRLSSDDDDLLQLDVLQVLCSQWHDETLDGRVDTTNHNMVLDIRVVLKGCKRDAH